MAARVSTGPVRPGGLAGALDGAPEPHAKIWSPALAPIRREGACADLAVAAIRTNPGGCSEYRITHPLTILARQGAHVKLMWLKEMEEHHPEPGDFDSYDAVILQRSLVTMNGKPGWTLDGLPLFLAEERKRRERTDRPLRIIYESDDDIFNLDHRNPVYKVHSPPVLRAMERTARMADALFVSTPELAARWARLNPSIYRLPNSIDFSIRDWSTRPERHELVKDKLVIGWIGGAHHIGDEGPLVDMMRTTMQDLLAKHENLTFAMCSHKALMHYFSKRWELPAGRCVYFDPVPFSVYPLVLTQLDIGLAPIMDTSFNRCKSELRLLEYGAWGIPYIASRIAPYHRFHQETHGLGGYLAGSNAEWREHVTRLVEDHEERAVKSAAIAGVVKEKYDTDVVAMKWADALRAVKKGGMASTWTAREKPGPNKPCPCGSGLKYKRCACYGAWGK